MFSSAFPAELSNDVSIVLKSISKRTYNNIKVGESENYCSYTLLNGQTISFPYRIYYIEENQTESLSLTVTQKLIYHAIYSRSCNGFLREKHIKAILSGGCPSWAFPYILKVSDEYVVEILEAVYTELLAQNTDSLKQFCCVNLQSFLRSHDRMISYWNEFYRNQCFYYKDYIGKKLFSDCFGYTRSMEKERRK